MLEEQNNDQIKLQQAYQKVFNGEDGEIVLEDLQKRYFIHNPVYFPGCSGEDLAHRDGLRTVVLHIQRMLTKDIKETIKQVEIINKEAEEEHKI